MFIGLIGTVSILNSGSKEVESNPPKSQTAAQLPAASSKPSPAISAQERRRWAPEYATKMRKVGLDHATCEVSGNQNTVMTLTSEAVVFEEAVRTLQTSGYFDEVFEKGFRELIVKDTVGHEMSLKR